MLFHFGYPPIMKKMPERGGEELEIMMKYMKEHGIATSMDMAAVDVGLRGRPGETAEANMLKRVLPYVDFFVPSARRAFVFYLLDRPRYESVRRNGQEVEEDPAGDSLGSGKRDVRPSCRSWLYAALGAKMVLIECGAPGL